MKKDTHCTLIITTKKTLNIQHMYSRSKIQHTAKHPNANAPCIQKRTHQNPTPETSACSSHNCTTLSQHTKLNHSANSNRRMRHTVASTRSTTSNAKEKINKSPRCRTVSTQCNRNSQVSVMCRQQAQTCTTTQLL